MYAGVSHVQVFQDYKFHPSVQRWIIGQCLCVDERTVSSYGIRKDGDTAFLYLLSVKQAGLSEQRFQEDLTQAQAALRPAASLTDSAGVDDKRRCSTLPAAAPRKGVTCPCSAAAPMLRGEAACSQSPCPEFSGLGYDWQHWLGHGSMLDTGSQ